MTAVAPAPVGTSDDRGPGTAISPGTGDVWRRWRSWLVLAAAVVVGGTVIAAIASPHITRGYLDPGDPGANGARAVADIAAQRGDHVVRVTSVPAAVRSAASAERSRVTLVVTSPWLLTTGELGALSRVRADLLLLEPDPASLAALAPGVASAGAARVGAVAPGCSLPAAMLAGNADLGGTLLRTGRPGASRCYWSGGHPSLVRYTGDGRTVTVLGSGAAFRNSDLASLGNAALALNLLGAAHEIVWLVPAPPPVGAGATGQKPLLSLIPLPAYLVAGQLALAAVLCALWRVRRLGPLVTERLPAVVRATETVEGHGRLYRARRSRDQAAAALRDAARGRLAARLGLPETAAPAALINGLAQRTSSPPEQIAAILSGPGPEDDAALVRLADALDTIERKVRTP